MGGYLPRLPPPSNSAPGGTGHQRVEDLLYLECPGCERDEEKKHGDDYDPHVHVVPSCVEITLTGEQHITTQETRERVLKLDLDMFGKNALGETRTPKTEDAKYQEPKPPG